MTQKKELLIALFVLTFCLKCRKSSFFRKSEKARTGYDFAPTYVGKRCLDPGKYLQCWEYSHLREKKFIDGRLYINPFGTLPLTWEKDSVFMRFSKVFAVICMKNFYKNLVLFLPAAMFALS